MTDQPARTLSGKDPVLVAEDLVVRFDGLTAVDHVSLRVEPGELRAIIGPNGAGKTTLFNGLAGTISLDEGRVHLAGRDVTGAPAHRMARLGLSRAFQTPSTFPALTVRENVWLGTQSGNGWRPLTRARREVQSSPHVEELCTDVGIGDLMDEPASNLSHADQKLLDIAIALAMEPIVLLLDEPTQGVSPEEVSRLEQVAIRALERVKSVLMIEHNVGTVLEVASMVTVLDRGSVIAEGPPEQIAQDERVQSAYLGRA